MEQIVKKETRDSYGEALVELARKDKNVVALDCDLGRSTRSFRITEVDPDRFIEMGIAEQDMVSTAAGLAKMNKIVFANSFAIFITGRAFDQIRQQISLPRLNVKLCGSSGGLTQGPDGATHQSIIDLGLMRLLPNMIVINPADGKQTEQAVRAAYGINGPVYLRLSRYASPAFIPERCGFEVGKAQVLHKGKGIALCSMGPVMYNVLKAAEKLKEDGIDSGVFNFHTLKPFDTEMIKHICRNYKRIFSIEEHSIIGGLGTTISETMAEIGRDNTIPSLVRLGVKDCFGESGTADELLHKYKLDPEGIVESILYETNKAVY